MRVLEKMVKDPEGRYEHESLLGEERNQILHQWNETRREYDTHISIVAMFERVARRKVRPQP